jgi:hypothetical protein
MDAVNVTTYRYKIQVHWRVLGGATAAQQPVGSSKPRSPRRCAPQVPAASHSIEPSVPGARGSALAARTWRACRELARGCRHLDNPTSSPNLPSGGRSTAPQGLLYTTDDVNWVVVHVACGAGAEQRPGCCAPRRARARASSRGGGGREGEGRGRGWLGLRPRERRQRAGQPGLACGAAGPEVAAPPTAIACTPAGALAPRATPARVPARGRPGEGGSSREG